ncbi:unnamed protein product, partial [Ceratitis capitata]
MALKLKDNQYTRIKGARAGPSQNSLSRLNNRNYNKQWGKPKPRQSNLALAQKIINHSSVEWAINSYEKFKSPGIGGIWPAQLQNGEQVISAL